MYVILVISLWSPKPVCDLLPVSNHNDQYVKTVAYYVMKVVSLWSQMPTEIKRLKWPVKDEANQNSLWKH